MPEAASPTTLGKRYELVRPLGTGGAGTVHLARDLVLHRDVAVKVFRDDAHGSPVGGDSSGPGRFEQEGRLLAGLSHPSLVTVYDAGTDPSRGEAYLVMELVAGETLAARIADGPMPPALVATLGAELSGALAYVHRRGVVHRDVKPANVLLAPDDDGGTVRAKLTDFGIARLVEGARMTMHGMTIGTANYLSPEQAGGVEVGPPSDIYSLGLVLLECLTGAVAYPGSGVAAAAARMHRPPNIPATLGPAWGALLADMTRFEPASRPDALQVTAALAGLAATGPGEPTAPALPPGGERTEWMPAPGGAPAGATAVLPPALDPRAGRSSATAIAPPVAASAVPARTRRHPDVQWPLLVLAGLIAVAVLVVVVVASSSSNGTSSGRPNPTYPSVSGTLGTHLRQLQTDVAP